MSYFGVFFDAGAEAKIYEFDFEVLADDDILQFDVPMCDVLGMKVL